MSGVFEPFPKQENLNQSCHFIKGKEAFRYDCQRFALVHLLPSSDAVSLNTGRRRLLWFSECGVQQTRQLPPHNTQHADAQTPMQTRCADTKHSDHRWVSVSAVGRLGSFDFCQGSPKWEVVEKQYKLL